MYLHAHLLSHVQQFATSWTVACQASLSICFYRQNTGVYSSILAVSSSKVSSWPRGWTCLSCVSCIGGQILHHRANQEALFIHISSVQSLSHIWLLVTPWTAACQASLSITNSQSLPKDAHQVGDAIQTSHPLSSLSSSVFNLSQHQSLF